MAATRYIPNLLKLVWETHRGLTLAMIALRLVRGLVPVATLWVGKLIIDGVVAAQDAGTDWRAVFPLVVLEVGIVVLGELLARLSGLVDGLLADLFTIRVSVRLMEHAASLDLAQFEDPTFYDHLERARRQTTGRIGLLATLMGMGQSTITLVTLSAVLFAFNPWLMLLLVVAILPSFLGETHFAALQYSLMFRWTQQRRRLDYLRYVGASNVTAKEVQLFGLAPWIIARFRRLSEQFHRENRHLAIRRSFVSSGLSLISTAGYYGAYLLIIAETVAGVITLGSLTLLAASFARGRDLIQQLLSSTASIYDESLYLRDLFVFFEMAPTITSKPGAPKVPTPIREGFVFEDVGFRYPGSERWAVRHVNLRLRAGERVAFVGENGAGKTTLTKLLARLYDPTEGRILLDGVDLRDYDVASLRQAIGVIFQDFVRFDFRFDENIGVGEITNAAGYLDTAPDARPPAGTAAGDDGATPVEGDVPASIRIASEKSLAAALLPRMPAGWRQMLGRRFDDGVELSGGEWQKIALARAYMRDAQVLILDEPTAALDARAEYEVFLRFSELMAGRTAVIISHRFSTVRMADRIIVLQQGEIVEDGTHEALVLSGGLYGELFAMQAAGYR
ncbi:MAG TPA: ABC transporter ATP-binding protein [Gemmatimonadaceae bacterium]|nr:ABC transporter ATP-binding protein [Gemmatimonadaceae bacterium]